MEIILIILVSLVAIVIGGVFGYKYADKQINQKLTDARQNATDITHQAEIEAEQAKKSALVEARDESQRYQDRIEKDLQERRSEVSRRSIGKS